MDVKTVHCSKFIDINADIMDIMYTLGPLMSQDPILLAKIVRIGRAFLKDYYSTGSNSLQQDSPAIVSVSISLLYGIKFCVLYIYFTVVYILGKCLYCVFTLWSHFKWNFLLSLRMYFLESLSLSYLRLFSLHCRCYSATVAWQRRYGG